VVYLVIESEEELRQRLQEGWRIYRDARGFKLYDPQSRRQVRVSDALEQLCEYYYRQQRSEAGEGAATTRRPPTPPPPPPNSITESDVRFIMSVVRSRLDPKAPIMTKWIEDVSYWHHVIVDLGASLLPDLLALLADSEIDRRNPENLVNNMVSKFRLLKSRAAEVEKVEAGYRVRVGELERRVAELEDLLARYAQEVREAADAIEVLADRVKRTLVYFLVEVPRRLSEEARSEYLALARRVVEIWGGAVERGAGG
jgi:hypothetical protein